MKTAVATLLPFALVIALWAIVSATGLAPPTMLPSPGAVARALLILATEGDIYSDLTATLWRCLIGLAFSFVVGVPLGALMATSKPLDDFFTPLIRATYSMPKTAVVPLFILWFGVGLRTEVGGILLSALLPLIIYTYQGVQSVPRAVVWSAAAMGTPKHLILWRILLPASMQSSLAGLCLALGFTFVTSIATEMMAANSGIGKLIFIYGESGSYDYMFAAVLALITIVFLADAGLQRATGFILRWQDPTQRHA